MLKAIQRFFETHMRPEAAEAEGLGEQRALQLATVALLLEMTRADFHVHGEELKSVAEGVRELFKLSAGETRELLALAEQEADESVSLYQFTSLINDHFSARQKTQVVELLWRVAYADGHKSHHEEHLVRKIADLLHVPHREFIKARHRVEGGE